MNPSMSQATPSAPTPSTPPTPGDNSIAFEVIDPLVAGLTASPAAAPQPLTDAQKKDKYDLKPATPIPTVDIDLTVGPVAPAQPEIPMTPPQPRKSLIESIAEATANRPTEEVLKARLAILEAREAEEKANKLNEAIKPTAEQPMPEVGKYRQPKPVDEPQPEHESRSEYEPEPKKSILDRLFGRSESDSKEKIPQLKEGVTTRDGSLDGNLLREIAEKFSPKIWKPSFHNADYTVDNLINNSKESFTRSLKSEGAYAAWLLPTFAGQVTLLSLSNGLGAAATAITTGAITIGGSAAVALVLLPTIGTGVVGAVLAVKVFKAWRDNRNLINALKENNFDTTEPAVPEERYTYSDAAKDLERIKKNAEAEKVRQVQTPVGPTDYSVTIARQAEEAGKWWRSRWRLSKTKI